MYGWKWSSNDFLCRPHHSLEGLLLCGGAAAIPYWEAAGQDVLYGALLHLRPLCDGLATLRVTYSERVGYCGVVSA